MTNPATDKAMFEVYKDGSLWAFKTPHGIEKRVAKQLALRASWEWVVATQAPGTQLDLPDSLLPFERAAAERLRDNLVNKTWTDDDGALHWCSNDTPVPLDVFKDALQVPPAAQQVVRDQHTAEFLARYREQMKDYQPSDEERFEMRAAFGPGETVVNVITGQSWKV